MNKTTNIETIADFPTSEVYPIAVLFNHNGRYTACISKSTCDHISELTRDKKLVGDWLHGPEWVVRNLFNLPISADVSTTPFFYFGYSHEEKFYSVANADCAFPPFAIVDANDLGDAIETYSCEFENWVKIDEPDLSDYDDESITWNDNGTPCDTTQVVAWDLELVSVLYSIPWIK